MADIDKDIIEDAAVDNTDNTENAEKSGAASGFKLGGIGKKMPKIGGRGRSAEKEKKSQVDEIRKLSRTELLEMLIDETKEAERLRIDNERLEKENKRLRKDLEKVASLDKVIGRLQDIVDRAGH